MIEATPSGRVRAFGYFVIAGVYFFFAQTVATHAASGLASGEWYELVERIILLFLLLIGYTAMGRVFQRQNNPIEAMGLVRRAGWRREFTVGAALGWGMMIAAILPMVLIGGLIVTVWAAPHQFFILAVDVLLLAVASLGEEVVFRGYPFQRLIEVMGPFLATLVLSTLFGLAHALNPASSRRSIIIAILAGWLLSDCVHSDAGSLDELGLALCLERQHGSDLRLAGERHHPVLAGHSEQHDRPFVDHGRRIWSGGERGDRRGHADRADRSFPDDARLCREICSTGHRCPRRASQSR